MIMTLLDKVIKLAQDKPEFRKHLVPVIRKMAEKEWTKIEWETYKDKHPGTQIKPKFKKDQTPSKEEKSKETQPKETLKIEKPKVKDLPADAPKVKTIEWERERQDWLKATADKEPQLVSVTGAVTKDSVQVIMKNAHSFIDAYKEVSLPEDVDQIKEYLSDLDSMLTKNVDGILKDVNATRLNNVVQACVENLVYQTYESYTRQLGDHGVRHILGNIRTQNSIFDSLEKAGKKVSAKDRLQALIIQSNHDIGYATDPARENFKYAGMHKEYSTQIIKESIGADLEAVFGDAGAEYIYYATGTHDDAYIDWDNDLVASAVRVADNLSLYSGEKLPALFREIPGSIEILESMHKTKKDTEEKETDSDEEKKGKKTTRKTEIDKLKEQLKEKVNGATDVSSQLKEALLQASKEVSDMTPKFTLGMLGGKLDKYDFKGNTLKVRIKKDNYMTRLMELGFDLGQSQFGKLAEAYKIDPKTLTSPYFIFGNPPVLEVEVGD
jgi:hypothetical protein